MSNHLSGFSDAGDAANYSLRPLVLFVACYTIIGIIHECAHALAAYVFKVPFTLTHLYSALDPARGTFNEVAVIRAAGPLSCLIVGLISWFGYERAKGTRAELWFLYLAWFGVATFFGNLISTAFVGDFSRIAQALQLPMSIRYGMSIAGAVLLCGLAFVVGRELRKWAPPEVNAVKATISVIVIPVVLGSALAILIYLPMPFDFLVGRMGELAFWIFGAIGTFVSRKKFQSIASRRVSWVDVAILLSAVGVLRVMARGISVVP